MSEPPGVVKAMNRYRKSMKRAAGKNQPLALRKAALKTAKTCRALLDLSAKLRAKSPVQYDGPDVEFSPMPRSLIAWAPEGLPPTLGAVMVLPGPMTEQEWRNALEARVQDLIDQDPDAAEVVAHVLEAANPPSLDPKNKKAWAETLFQAVPEIRLTLNQNSQTWPVEVTSSDGDVEESLDETTLEGWLLSIDI